MDSVNNMEVNLSKLAVTGSGETQQSLLSKLSMESAAAEGSSPVFASDGPRKQMRGAVTVNASGGGGVVLFNSGSSAPAAFSGGWSPAGFSGVEICGDRGCITVDCNAGETTLCAGEIKPDGSCNLNRKLLASAPKPHWQSEMAELLRQYRNHLPFTAGMKEGIAALRVALAVYRSSQTGQRIDLEGGEA